MLRKKVGSKSKKIYVGSTFVKHIQELDPRDDYKYLGTEESYDIQHKNEKEKLKEEYFCILRIVMGTELSAKNKIQAIGSLVVPALELLTGAKKNCKNRLGKRGHC